MRRITPGGRETNSAGVWSRDSRWLAWTSNHKNPRSLIAYVFDVTTGESTEVADLEGTGVILDFSPGRKQAVITRLRSRGSNDLYARDLTTARDAFTPHQGPDCLACVFAGWVHGVLPEPTTAARCQSESLRRPD
jgi:Tol biopolymer transport system component